MTTPEQANERFTEALKDMLLGEKLQLEIVSTQTGEIIIPANRKITLTLVRKLAAATQSGWHFRRVSFRRRRELESQLNESP